MWSKAWVCGCSLAGMAVSNPVGGMDVYYEWCVLCRYRALSRADHSSRGVLPSVVSQRDLETSTISRPRPTTVVETWKKHKIKFNNFYVPPFFFKKKRWSWKDWLSAEMCYTMLPAKLLISKYMWLVIYYFLKFPSLYFAIFKAVYLYTMFGVRILLRVPQFEKPLSRKRLLSKSRKMPN